MRLDFSEELGLWRLLHPSILARAYGLATFSIWRPVRQLWGGTVDAFAAAVFSGVPSGRLLGIPLPTLM